MQVGRFPSVALDRMLRGRTKCAAFGCFKPAINGREHCQLHAKPGKIGKSKSRGLGYDEAFIYAIECSGFVKIGQTETPKKRLSSLQTANPFDLVYLGDVILSKDYEELIHNHLAPHRHRLEWFRKHHDVLRVVDMIVGKDAQGIIKLVAKAA